MEPARRRRSTNSLHLAFTAYAFNSEGDLLLTRRSTAKKTWPGVWTNTCCGHPLPEERLEDAVRRRIRDELGTEARRVDAVLPKVRYRAVMANGVVENEMGPVLRVLLSEQVVVDLNETDQVAWVPPGVRSPSSASPLSVALRGRGPSSIPATKSQPSPGSSTPARMTHLDD